MTHRDFVRWVDNVCTDWNGTKMADEEVPRVDIRCCDLRGMASEIERLRTELKRIRDYRYADNPEIESDEAGIARRALEQSEHIPHDVAPPVPTTEA